MARISYVDIDQVRDPEVREYLEYAACHSTPRPEIQAIRAHVPAVIRSFTQTWNTVFHDGVLDHGIKELCRVYVSKTLECHY